MLSWHLKNVIKEIFNYDLLVVHKFFEIHLLCVNTMKTLTYFLFGLVRKKFLHRLKLVVKTSCFMLIDKSTKIF